jgi:hypothetical protein
VLRDLLIRPISAKVFAFYQIYFAGLNCKVRNSKPLIPQTVPFGRLVVIIFFRGWFLTIYFTIGLIWISTVANVVG